MKTWMIFPDYWEKGAGDEPSFVVSAETREAAEKAAYPPPWNVTFGVRAIEIHPGDLYDRNFGQLIEPEI